MLALHGQEVQRAIGKVPPALSLAKGAAGHGGTNGVEIVIGLGYTTLYVSSFGRLFAILHAAAHAWHPMSDEGRSPFRIESSISASLEASRWPQRSRSRDWFLQAWLYSLKVVRARSPSMCSRVRKLRGQ